MADLFSSKNEVQTKKNAPLAERMRPTTLEAFIGQQKVVGEGTVLRKALADDTLFSLILWGPPGCGKTTLARIIAGETRSTFVQFSAVMAGVGEVRNVIERARNRRSATGGKTILFLDEIHRWNKAQQDALLPHVEDGTIILIGATTENPSFEVIGPLLSRSKVIVLDRLNGEHIREIILRALSDVDQGLGSLQLVMDDDALTELVEASNGDARTALNALEVASHQTSEKRITAEHVRAALMHAALLYDKHGEEHYNTVSAFIKSMRGSDANASLYWLARMIEAGEDPRFIVRRMIILASEDIGNADPQALVLAVAAAHAVDHIGMPEAQLTLAQTAAYLALAPKSNATYRALQEAQSDVQRTRNIAVPLHLRNAVTSLMKDVGYGKGYHYPHDDPSVDQQYLPDESKGRVYYRPPQQQRQP